MTVSVLSELELDGPSSASRVNCRVLAPVDPAWGDAAPLILHLHGAMSSADFLGEAQPVYDAAWTSGALPPAVVACASTPTLGGFYIDHPEGAAWERFVGQTLPEALAQRFTLSDRRALVGFSMGGYGALKLAFRNPQRYRGVAALCPAIFPAEEADDVPEKNRPSILGDLNRSMGRTPERYAHNCVQTILRCNRATVRASDLRIYLECGAQDEFGLHDGSLHLHDLMSDLRVRHCWRSWPGIGHMADGAERLSAALAFLGSALAVRG